MEQIIIKIIELIILVIATLVGRYIIPLLKTRLNFEKIKMVTYYADTFVNAAEQLFCGEGLGEKKYDTVYKALTEKINDLGIKISSQELQMIIEEAVKQMNDMANK